MEETEPVPVAATCHTPGCPNEGRTFKTLMYPSETPPTFRAVCGQCGQPITDITPL